MVLRQCYRDEDRQWFFPDEDDKKGIVPISTRFTPTIQRLARTIVGRLTQMSRIAAPELWKPKKTPRWRIEATRSSWTSLVVEANSADEAELVARESTEWHKLDWQGEKMRDWDFSDPEAVGDEE